MSEILTGLTLQREEKARSIKLEVAEILTVELSKLFHTLSDWTKLDKSVCISIATIILTLQIKTNIKSEIKSQAVLTLTFFEPLLIEKLDKQEKTIEGTKKLLDERISNAIKKVHPEFWSRFPQV